MKINTNIIIAVLIVAIIELAGLYYLIANDNPLSDSNSGGNTANNNIVKYTKEEMIGLALSNDTVKEYTSHLKYNISDIDEGMGYLHIDLGNDTIYWVSLSIGFNTSQKAIEYVRLSGYPQYSLADGGGIKVAMMNETVNGYIGNKTSIVSEVNESQHYVIFSIGDMIWTCDRLKVGVDSKSDTVTYVQDLGPMTLVLPSQNSTGKIADITMGN